VIDDYVQVATDGSGKKVDNSKLTVGANDVYRQRTNIADPELAAAIAVIRDRVPALDAQGLVVRTARGSLDDAITLLQRIVKLLEPSGQKGLGGLQRVQLDTLGPTTAIGATLPISGTITGITNPLAAGTNVIGQVYMTLPDSRALYRMAYNTGPRANLKWA
jgi:hypothetical protein